MATIRKRGDKWQVQVRKNGQIASRTFTKRADAASWARETEQQAERGQLRRTQKAAPVMTVAKVLARYRDDVTPTKAHPEVERWRINAMMRSKLAGMHLDVLSAADVAKWRDQRLQGVKPGTVVRELSLLQSAIDLACAEWQQGEHMPHGNPLRTVRRPRVDDRRERRLQPGEWQRLLDAVDEKRSPLLKPLLMLARETGMRRSELLRAEWKHVDLEACTLHLPKTKNGHPRDVPLSPVAVQLLAKLPRTDDRVLPLSVNSVRLAWQRLRNRARLDDLRLHDLRAQCATDRLLDGWSVAEVQVQTGHRDPTVLLNRYARLQASDVVAKLHARREQP